MSRQLLIVLGVLIVGGGIFFIVWRMIVPASQNNVPANNSITNSSQSSANGSGSYTNTTVNNSTTATGQTSTAPTQSLGQQYQSIFTQLSATQVSFTPTTSGDIYALYASDIATSKQAFPKAVSYSIGVAMTDINGDGVDEALVLENLPGFCGTAGCPFDVYKKQGSQWVKIFSTLVQGNVGLSTNYVNSYQALLLVVEANGQSSLEQYVWNGSSYQASAVVAVWNGSSFQLSQ